MFPMLSRILGRPGPRLAEPSYLLATSFLNQLKKRVRGDDSSELLEGLRSQCLGLHTQPTPLLVSESDPTTPLRCFWYTRISSRR